MSISVPPAGRTDLLDLVAELHAVLELVDTEFEQIADMPQPTPDWVQEAFDERLALLTALKAAPEAWKPRLRELFLAAQGETLVDLPSYPVDGDVRRRLAETLETVRRRALLDVVLADALRQPPNQGAM